MSKINLNEQAKEIIRVAEESGAQSNFFFVTTFKRYQVQLQILNELEQTLNEDGLLVTKEYVKGRQNIYSHPAINDYNKTTDSANKTVQTLMRILKNYNVEYQYTPGRIPSASQKLCVRVSWLSKGGKSGV